MTMLRALLALVVCWPLWASAPAHATQTLTLDWAAPSSEAAPLIGYRIQGAQTAAGTRATLSTVEAETTATLSVADGPWWLWIEPYWLTTPTVFGAAVGPVTNGATVTLSAGANGSGTPATRSVLLGTTTSFTLTPDSGYATEAGGDCGGSLDGTTFTTGTIAGDCTVVAQFVTEASGDDLVAPTLSSATVNAAGTVLTLAFSEAVTLNGAIPTLSGTGPALTASNPSTGSASSHTWDLSRTVQPGEVLYLAYTQPGNGIEDAAGNDLLSITAFSATNGSTATVLSAATLSPTAQTIHRRTQTAVSLIATTDAAAQCVAGRHPGIAWADGEAMAASGGNLTHTLAVAAVPGGVYRRCVLCRDASTLATIPATCTAWAIEPANRWSLGW